jgi:hypothetical protein
MERSRSILLVGGILFLMAAWFLFLSGLAFAGRGWAVGAIPDEMLRRYQIAAGMSGVINATVLVLAGIGIVWLATWSRPLALVLACWSALGALGGLLGSGGGGGWRRMASAVLLVVAILLIGTLFMTSVQAALARRPTRPRGVTVLGVLYFIQAIVISAVANSVMVWNVAAGFLIVAVFMTVFMVVGVGLLELQPWARMWTMIVAGVTVGVAALGWIILLAREPSQSALGSYLGENVIALPVSLFALWYLTRPPVKESFTAAENVAAS